ncbi:T9SS type A sorting domain-containing protein [Aquimarina algiphila]|uniref:T9SS type A sorting domain-containing protein n=1 Tax=Aquimarina algiphila TaxID=2047982 RepID=UPI0024932489|nr:T9SS type A sorting domain-containing protein [Aquimarina algiphila]
MNKSLVWGLLCLALTFTQPTFAQLTKTECDQKAEIILALKNDFKDYPNTLIDEFIEEITPCADLSFGRTSPASAYAKGLLHFKKGDFGNVFGSRKELSKLYLLRSAAYNYPPGMLTYNLKLLTNSFIESDDHIPYNEIIQDLNGALTQEYKTDVTHYVLGYLHLKNLLYSTGVNIPFTTQESANKAKVHFESSNHPMAKHWLAIMHYYGYGVPQDKAKGLQMLSENDIFNSRSLVNFLQNHNTDWIPISAEERLIPLQLFYNLATPDINSLKDKVYQGHWVEYDLMNKEEGVKRYTPMSLDFTRITPDANQSNFGYKLTVDGKTAWLNASLSASNNQVSLKAPLSKSLLLPALESLLQDHPDKNTVTYKVTGVFLNFAETEINGKTALLGELKCRVAETNERIGAPIRLILYPEAPTPAATSNTIAEASLKTEMPLVLDKDFATISPNPIGDQFNITYSLDQQAEVQVSIYDFFGHQRVSLPSQNTTTIGQQTMTIDSSTLPSGTYIIQMIIDGQPYSKTVVKL